MLKKINSRLILYITTLSIFISVPLLQMISYYLQVYRVIPNYDSLNPIIIFVIAHFILLGIYIYELKKKKLKLDKYDIIFFITTIIGIIISIFAINRDVSFFGKEYRHEGLFAIITYNLLFINWRHLANKEYTKKILEAIIWIAFFNVMYGLLQVYTDYDFIIRSGAEGAATGFCGHNNFFGSLMVTALTIMSCKFLIEKKFKIKDIFMIFILLVGLINSQSSGPVLAYVVAMFFIVIFLFIKKSLSLRKFLVMIVVPITLIVSINLVNIYIFHNENCELCDIKANVIDNGGNGRSYIWKNSFEVAKDYLLLGVGYDNLVYVYPPNYRNYGNSVPIVRYIVDNAHNIYLHTLVSSGIYGLITYLLLCLVTFIKGLRSKDKITYILFAGFVAYSIQAFFNISVIQVAPIYYVIIGLILGSDNDKKKIIN